MMKCFYKSLIFLLLLTLFIGCDSKQKTKTVNTQSNFDIPLVNINDLSKYHQYTQHVIINIPQQFETKIDSIVPWIIKHQPGGLILDNWSLNSIKMLSVNLDSQNIIKPFILDSFYKRINSKYYNYAKANNSLSQAKFSQFLIEAGVNFIYYNNASKHQLSNKKSLIINYKISTQNIFALKQLKVKEIKKTNKHIFIDAQNLKSINLTKYKKQYQLKGLLITNTKNVNESLLLGADMIINNSFNFEFNNFESTKEFEKSTAKILGYKQKLKNSKQNINANALQKYTKLNFQQKATALINNKANFLPTSNIDFYSLKSYSKKSIKQLENSKKSNYIILPDTLSINDLKMLKSLQKSKNVVVCFSNVNYYPHLKKIKQLVFIPPIKSINKSILKQQLLGKISFEANFIYKNKLIKSKKYKSTQLSTTPSEFVGIDNKVLNNITYLVNSAIDGKAFPGCQIIGAKDGCVFYNKSFGHHTYSKQIKVKQNSIYDIASLTKIVSTTLMAMKFLELNSYKLTDSLKVFLPDSLAQILGKPSTLENITFQELLTHTSGLPAGFPIVKYLNYKSNTIGRFDKYFCDTKNEDFTTEVANEFYLEKAYQDSMWLTLNQIWLDQSKPYKYSDVNMNTLYFILKSIIHSSPQKFGYTGAKNSYKDKNLYVKYLYKTFYKSLGMNSTLYNPTKNINLNRIVPTEKDTYWRKQLLQGYVHDPNAALYGGVAGNAGIFTNTNNLVILLQMLLNNGVYNNKKYLKPETIQQFISTQPNSHRGLGFNKRTLFNAAYAMADSAGVNTYGHTGFTGTCFWVDPDNKIIYIFLANRVHPRISNKMYEYGIRKNVHQVFYDALLY